MKNSTMGVESHAINKRIISLANDGLSIQQLADAVGLTKPAIASRMTALMRDGKLKRRSERTGSIDTQRGRYYILHKRFGRRLGSAGEMITKLTLEEAEWLFKTAPEGMTVSEWCAVLLRDVIAEENGQ